jgi:glycosyltransferase involved in cell wall biosynthesis
VRVPGPDLVCSVVVPTYNAERSLAAQLAALARQTHPGLFEVLIADNGSTDGSTALAESWRDRLPHLRVVDASRARGVSAARNDGIRAAATDLILICDADDVVADDWVEAMLRGLDDHDFVGGVLDTRQLSTPEARHWSPLETVSTALPTVWGGRGYAFGGNMGMRRVVFEDAGGFDESYGAGAEEIDFAWRARDAGHEVAFVRDAVVHYRLRGDLRGMLRQQYHSGLGTAQLYVTFRPDQVPTRSWHRRLRHELLLVRRFPWRGPSGAREDWLTTAAFELGMARGAIRHRSRVP